MGGLGLMHWVVVLIVFLLLFGAGRVADLGKGLGEGIRNLKKGLEGDDDKPKKDANPELPKQASPAKKVIQVEVDEGEDEAEALKAAAEKAAAKKSPGA